MNPVAMRNSQPPALLMALSVLLLVLAVCVIGFLTVWYFELALWGILGPFAIASLNLGLRIWRPSGATRRATIYWAISVAWVLLLVLLFFKDVILPVV